MNDWQTLILAGVTGVGGGITVRAIEMVRAGKAFAETGYLLPLGIFVWGDAIVLGPFWMSVSLLSLLVGSWWMFLFIVGVYWIIRGLGEVVYWLNEQFASQHRNKPEHMKLFSFFKSDAVWFVYQLVWQCVTVMAIVFSIYAGAGWIRSM